MLYGQLTTLWKYTKCMPEFTGKVMSCDGCWEKGGGGGWPQAHDRLFLQCNWVQPLARGFGGKLPGRAEV